MYFIHLFISIHVYWYLECIIYYEFILLAFKLHPKDPFPVLFIQFANKQYTKCKISGKFEDIFIVDNTLFIYTTYFLIHDLKKN